MLQYTMGLKIAKKSFSPQNRVQYLFIYWTFAKPDIWDLPIIYGEANGGWIPQI